MATAKKAAKKTPKPKFRVNDRVRILKYKKDGINGYGRVDQVQKLKNRSYRYRVVNGNMPYQGTVNDWFKAGELRLDPPDQHRKRGRCLSCGQLLPTWAVRGRDF
jgi:hypothetical protein